MDIDGELPGDPRTVDDLVAALRDLRSWSGMSYRAVHRELVRRRVSLGIPERPAYDTVYRAFQPGRARLDPDLVVEIACVLHGEDSAAKRWRLACQALASRLSSAALVDVSDRLPEEPAASFVGRRNELAEVDRLVDAGARGIAFVGMAGAGKTRLAMRVGHVLLRAGRFDRVLSVDLRGFDPQRPPAEPAAVLQAFLRVLGMPADRAHRLDAAGRSAAYRTLLTEARTLVLLDNAATAAQMRPLLPTVAGSLALITSRRDVADLPDLHRVAVGLLPEREAFDLLRDVVGADRVDGDPATATALTEMAGQLPLALVMIAARILNTPRWTLADHLDRLRHRQDILRTESTVELALDASHDAMPAGERKTLRLLALHPGADLTADTAAALAGVDVSAAVRDLARLTEANLLQANGSGRYTCHDLVRLYALNRGHDEEAPSARCSALDRLRRYYERAAAQEVTAFASPDVAQLSRLGPVDSTERFAERETAKAWLDAEWHNLVATALHAAQHGRGEHASHQSYTLTPYLAIAAHFADAELLHATALGCPDVDQQKRDHHRNSLAGIYTHLGRFQEVLDLYRTRAPHDIEDAGTRRTAHNILGVVFMQLGRCVEALEHHQHGLDLARDMCDRQAVATVLCNLSLVYEHMGHYDAAVDCLRMSVELAAESGFLAGEATAHANLSVVFALTGRTEEAFAHNYSALRIARAIGNRKGVGLALGRQGVFHANRGEYHEAESNHQESLRIAREIGDPDSEWVALRNIGALALLRRQAPAAVTVLTEALEVTRQALLARGETDILNHLGHALLAAGAPGDARKRYREALEMATAIGAPREMAHAHQGIADTSAPDSADARHHGAEALRLCADFGFKCTARHPPSASRHPAGRPT